MELDGCKRCFQFLKEAGLKVSTFISDRHKGIAKWVRTSQAQTQHFYDLWHIAKGIVKKILKESKQNGCEILKEWTKRIRKHLYWCATSTRMGFGEMIVAKWNSIVRHISNRHDGHSDKLFAKCAHGELEPRKWIKPGTQCQVVVWKAVQFSIKHFILILSFDEMCVLYCPDTGNVFLS